jgi:hypothetical protein
MPREIRSPFARQEDLEGLRAEVEAWATVVDEDRLNLEARVSVIERALESVIEDLEILTGVAEPADTPNGGIDTESKDDYGVEDAAGIDGDGESPEEEAARLRREAIAEFEQSNEAAPAAADFNDVADVPEEGRDV